MKKYILILLSFACFIPSAPYLWEAWRSSRLDGWDWIFYLLTIPAVCCAIHKNPCGKWDYRAIGVAVLALIMVLARNVHHINALCVIGSGLFVWSAAWGVGGWNFAYRLLPCLLLLLLGTPSSSYRLAQLFSLSTAAAMMLKGLAAAGCFGWIYANRRLGQVVKGEAILFTGAVLFTGALLLHADELYFSGKSYIPAFPNQAEQFFGRSIEPDRDTRKFFATSTVRQFRYIADDQEIAVLAVKCGNDVHEIHPASHCLRTSRWVVTSEKIYSLRRDFAVTEIVAHKGGLRSLIWVWYSNDQFSTPGFLGFRRRFRPNGNFHTFQISIPVTKDIETARKALSDFVSVLTQESAK